MAGENKKDPKNVYKDYKIFKYNKYYKDPFHDTIKGKIATYPLNKFGSKPNNKVKGTVSIKPAWVHTSRKGGAR